MDHVASKVDGILLTHGHFDHLLDVPVVMALTRARLVASTLSVDLAERAGASPGDAVRAATCDELDRGKFACYRRRTIGSSGTCHLIDRIRGRACGTRVGLDLQRTACVLHRSEQSAHLHRFRWNTSAIAA
jgi:ribonuclease BN (tRNA processing enzyme)